MMSDYSGDYPNDEPVIIPPPGVPSDIFVSLDDILGEVDQSDKVLDKNGMADFDTYFDDARDDERNQQIEGVGIHDCLSSQAEKFKMTGMWFVHAARCT